MKVKFDDGFTKEYAEPWDLNLWQLRKQIKEIKKDAREHNEICKTCEGTGKTYKYLKDWFRSECTKCCGTGFKI